MKQFGEGGGFSSIPIMFQRSCHKVTSEKYFLKVELGGGSPCLHFCVHHSSENPLARHPKPVPYSLPSTDSCYLGQDL